MSRPRALVAEDEVPQRRRLCELLGELWPELEVVAECGDGLAALEALTGQHPDVAFLDIRMPGLTGSGSGPRRGVHARGIHHRLREHMHWMPSTMRRWITCSSRSAVSAWRKASCA